MKKKYINKNQIVGFLLATVFGLMNFSCKKGWLDAKPDTSLVVPGSIADYQAILDNSSSAINSAPTFNSDQSALNEVSAGDFYVKDATYSTAAALERNAYIWADDFYAGAPVNIADWNLTYNRIFNTNIILEGIEKIIPLGINEIIAWNQVKGSALFFRAYNHFSISQGFCKTYDNVTAATDLGIPLKLTANVNEESRRSTVEQTYNQILEDLKLAKALLPVEKPDLTNPLYKLRPTKTAADAMLAKVYLIMGNYDSALVYSDNCLMRYNALLDFNNSADVNLTNNNPFARFNKEVIFHNRFLTFGIFLSSRLIVDSLLFNLYTSNDQRRTAYFRIVSLNNSIKGGYNAGAQLFSGIATDEIYLIRSECKARKGNIAGSMDDLNALLIKRWKTGFFVPNTANTQAEALNKILLERRKELCFRGLRWSDLRRLNKDPQYAVSLRRVINGQSYDLLPNSLKYVFPIPPNVIQLNGMPQNPR